MRKTLWLVVALIGWIVAPTWAHAEEGWYFGGKLAYFETDEDDVLDDPDNAGLMVGYDWGTRYGLVGVEGDFTTTFLEGDFQGEEVEADTAGLFATFKTRGLSARGIGIYLKVKAGAVYSDVTRDSGSDDETNASAGLGIGVNLLTFSFEFEYTILRDNVDMLSLGVRY